MFRSMTRGRFCQCRLSAPGMPNRGRALNKAETVLQRAIHSRHDLVRQKGDSRRSKPLLVNRGDKGLLSVGKRKRVSAYPFNSGEMGNRFEFRVPRDQHSRMIDGTGQSKTVGKGERIFRLDFRSLVHKLIEDRHYRQSQLLDVTQHLQFLFVSEPSLLAPVRKGAKMAGYKRGHVGRWA